MATPHEITMSDSELLTSVLVLTESDIDVLHDQFTESPGYPDRAGMGHAGFGVRPEYADDVFD